MSKPWEVIVGVVGIALLLGGLVGLAGCGKTKPASTTSAWKWQNPLPQGNQLHRVWGSQVGWAWPTNLAFHQPGSTRADSEA